MDKTEKLRVLADIIDDARADAARFDGQPFNGRTVAEYFGCLGAQVSALANILKEVIEESQNEIPNSKD